jgi:flagellar basal-body rod protein FlgF
MADGIYISMCGAVARSEQLDAIADNLANAQTVGFKAIRPAFQVFMAASGAQDKHYAATVGSGLDLRPGPSKPTGNPLHVLPDDGAFLTVRERDGSMAYTRDGRLTVDDDLRLLSGTGLPVLDPMGQPIVVPRGVIPTIDGVGRVMGDGAEIGALALARLEGAFERSSQVTFVPGPGGRAVPLEGGTVRTGEVEVGNAGAVDTTIAMIGAQRKYDASMQAIQTYRQMDQRANELGRTR